MTARLGRDLFARHLDLAPLGGRRRGRVLCIFHHDSTPSLSVDLDRGLFHCFACGAQGGLLKFAELVGKREPRSQPTARWESPLDHARREILAKARRQPWYCEEIRLLYKIADAIRRRRRVAALTREAATKAGDLPESWDQFAMAAHAEIEAERIEAELNEALE